MKKKKVKNIEKTTGRSKNFKLPQRSKKMKGFKHHDSSSAA